MFGKLQGKIDFVGSNFAILMAGGVGFKVMAPSGLLARLRCGDDAALWIETIAREDSISLVGFETLADQELFVKLTGVSGIGPKLALAMLGAKSAVIETAIAEEDVATLTSVPGVGKKVAERIIVELKGKVCASGGGKAALEALEALEALGYRRADASGIVHRLAAENPADDVQSLITKALKEYAR